MQHGAQLAIDITLRSANSTNGLPQRNAAHTDASCLDRTQDGQGGHTCGACGREALFVGRDRAGDWRTMEWRSGGLHRHDGWCACTGSSPDLVEVGPLGVETVMDVRAGCVLCPGFRELHRGSWSGRVEWH